METETEPKKFIEFDPSVPPYTTQLSNETRRNFGLEGVQEKRDGYEILKEKFKRSHLFKESEDITDGPYQAMVNNVAFRVKVLHEMQDRYNTHEIIPLGSHTLIIGEAEWNKHAAKQYITDIVSLKDDEWTSVIFSFPMIFEAQKGETIEDVHWVGVELFKEGETQAIIYDPAYSCPRGKRGLATSTWMDLEDSLYGLVLPIIVDPGVRKKMSWKEINPDEINELIKEYELLPEIVDLSDFAQLAVLLEYFVYNERRTSDVSFEVLKLMFKLSGNVRAFYPEFTACQISQSDYFCQSWSLYLVLSRIRGNNVSSIKRHISSKVLGVMRPQRGLIEKLPCPGLGASVKDQMRIGKEILSFARWLVLKTDAAEDFWLKQNVSDDDGKEYTGDMLYKWLIEATKMKRFGRQFLKDIAKERRVSIQQNEDLVAQFGNLLLSPKKNNSSGLYSW